ncbi:hypothetical protein FOZ62_010311 [Perkinsus olseni]|uniref:RRM domain-containing protein n=1 Tax=Perkinsus olseni TaxID=32597 RepID=A0A7J6SF34_PEROL|nr:hypothetical protein FOZ62_010311 [Perkinsus olseni]
MEKSNLIINYLPSHIQESDLAEMFEPFGPYHSVKIVRDKNTGMSMGFGFVNYEENTSAEAAVKELNGLELPQHAGTWRGPGPRPMKKIKVSIARPAWKANIHSNLYVANIPTDYDASKIKALFGPVYGPQIEHLRMLRDNSGGKLSPEQSIEEDTGSNNKGKFRGIAVIRFDTEENAAAAMEKFNGTAVPDMPASHLPLHIKPWRPEFRADRVPQRAPVYTKRNSRGSQRSVQSEATNSRVERSSTGRSSARRESRGSGDHNGFAESSSNTSVQNSPVSNSDNSLERTKRSWKGWAGAYECSGVPPDRRGVLYEGPSSSRDATVGHLSGRTLGAASYRSSAEPQQIAAARGPPSCPAPPSSRVNGPPSAVYPAPLSHRSMTSQHCQHCHSSSHPGEPHVNDSAVYGHACSHQAASAVRGYGVSNGSVGPTPLPGGGDAVYQTPIKQKARTASETPGRNAFSPITPMMISPQIEQIAKTMFYNQAGIVGSSVQVGPDRSWGCASFSSLADAQQAIRSLYGTQFGDGVSLLVEFFPHSNQLATPADVHGDHPFAAPRASHHNRLGQQLEVKS